MPESPLRFFERGGGNEEAASLEELAKHEYVVSAEPSPHSELIDSYQINPELESELKELLGSQYETFTDLVEGIKRYLGGPLIKDTFGNQHLEGDEEHGGMSRREFVRSFGESSPTRTLLDRNRLKLGTHCNAIFPRLELLHMIAPQASEKLNTLFAGLPLETYQRIQNHEELSDEDKEEWVRQMDGFAVAFLNQIAAA